VRKFRQRHPDYSADLAELEHVKPAFTRLIFANERLVLVDARGKVCLRQSGVCSYLTQESKQPLVLRGVDALPHPHFIRMY